VYVGQGAYRAMEDREGWRDRQQLPNQVRYLRDNPRVQGSVYFSSRSLTNNLAGFRDTLQHDLYRYPALQPVMPWLGMAKPAKPEGLREDKFLLVFPRLRKAAIRWDYPDQEEDVYGFVVYRFDEKEPINLEHARNIRRIQFNDYELGFYDETAERGKTYKYVVTSIDRLKNESAPSNVYLKKIR
jgi:hypothetical protein